MEITAWILAWFFYPANFLFILFINFFAKYCRQSRLLSLKIYIFFTSIFFVWESGELCVTILRQMILKDPKNFPKNFSHQNEAYLMPSKSKKNEARKTKKKGRRESEK